MTDVKFAVSVREFLVGIFVFLIFAGIVFVAVSFLNLWVASALLGGVMVGISFFQYKRHVFLSKRVMAYDELAAEVLDGKGEGFASYDELSRKLRESEVAMQRSEQLVRSVTEVIVAPLVIVGSNGLIEYANDSFQKLVRRGKGTGSVLNMSYEKVKSDDLRALIQEALFCGVAASGEIEVRKKFYTTSSSPMRDGLGVFVGVLILFHDVTDLKRYQDLRREFFMNASHELKTPITAIKGCVDILLSGALDVDGREEFLTIVKDENERLEGLVKNLVLINRYDFNEMRLSRERISLNDLLGGVFSQVRSVASLKGQRLSLNVDGVNDGWVLGDWSQLELCFLNLITNAIHYSPEDTMIRVDLDVDGGYVVVKVIDQGIGIPKRDLPHVFERFYRVDSARARHSGGTGLGLSIVKSTVKAHKGKVKVRSDEGSGTTFIVSLPVMD